MHLHADEEIPMIEASGLTKRYGSTLAVDALSFDVRPGAVTGFLGPNGAGKSTTMRMVLGLDAPDAGEARIGGRRYRQLRWPLREVGALLEAKAFHPGRSARAHLSALAASNDLPRSRVEEVLGMVGLDGAASRRAGKYSLGMAQRLGVIGRGRLLAETSVAELSARSASLEEAFLELTSGSVEYRGTADPYRHDAAAPGGRRPGSDSKARTS